MIFHLKKIEKEILHSRTGYHLGVIKVALRGLRVINLGVCIQKTKYRKFDLLEHSIFLEKAGMKKSGKKS